MDVDCLGNHCINLLDDGFVRLVDMMPRMAPHGRSPDFAIVRNARVSFGRGLKSEEEDRALLRYLYINQHSTPFESVVFTFHLRLPRFVATHFHRHRTASINEFSQRYAEVKEDSFFHPSRVEGSLRLQEKFNKQGSDTITTDPSVVGLVKAMEEKVASLFDDYKALIKLGVGKEVARSFLPVSTYTEMYFTMNLRNLLHFLELRYDRHAQKETRDYAEAIYTILKRVVPDTIALFDEVTREGLRLTSREVEAFRHGSDLDQCSNSEKIAFEEKKKRLNG
jgi:thymidylate synthase (FAD)